MREVPREGVHYAWHTWRLSPIRRRLAPARRTDGFSGQQAVYEPVRDGELQYWCKLVTGKRSARREAL